jgi:hypothetical protein
MNRTDREMLLDLFNVWGVVYRDQDESNIIYINDEYGIVEFAFNEYGGFVSIKGRSF